MSDRKVHFSVPLHQIEYLDKQWETASRLARDGSDWLRMGLDRIRFRDRIERTAEILDKILDFEFRQQIYQERFENFVIQEEQTISRVSLPPNHSSLTTTTEAQQIVEPANATQQETSQKRSQTNQSSHRRVRRKKGNNKKRRKHRGGHRRKK